MLEKDDIGRGARNFSWLMAGNYLSYGLSLLTVVLVARELGPEKYGSLSSAVAYVGLFGILKLAGLDKVLTRRIAQDPSSHTRDYEEILGLKVITGAIGLTATVIGLAFMPFTGQERIAAAAFATTMLTQPVNSLVGSVFQAHEDMKWIVVVGLLRQGSYIVAASAGLYVLGISGVSFVAGCLAVSYWLGVAASLWVVRRYVADPFRPRFVIPAPEVIKAGVAFSLYTVVVYLYTKIDVLMARTMLGASAAGVYAVALNVFEKSNGPFLLMSTAFFPSLARRLRQPASMRYRQLFGAMAGFAALAILVAAAASVLAPWVIPVFFGQQYVESGSVVVLLLWALPAVVAIQPLITVLQACEFEGLVLKVAPLRAVMNVFFNLLFLRAGLGVRGIAYSSIMTSVLYMLVFGAIGLRVLRRHAELASGAEALG